MRFNFTFRVKAIPARNHEGATAYTLTPALELYMAVATAALSDQFYEAADARIERLRGLIARNDPHLVARLVVYAREQLHLRSVPLVLAVELARLHKGDSLVSRLVARIVQRADEIPERLAYYAQANGRTSVKTLGWLSKQLQHSLALAFNRFDGYQLVKYDRAGTAVRLRDALFLVHPKPCEEAQQAIFNHLMTGTLPVPYTWETELSAAGQVVCSSPTERQAAIARTWEIVVASGRLDYMALLRNLRNLLEAKVSAAGLRYARRPCSGSSRPAVALPLSGRVPRGARPEGGGCGSGAAGRFAAQQGAALRCGPGAGHTAAKPLPARGDRALRRPLAARDATPGPSAA